MQFVSLTFYVTSCARAKSMGPYWMGVQALDRNLPIPADAHDLRDPVSVVCVSLIDLKRQRSLCTKFVPTTDAVTCNGRVCQFARTLTTARCGRRAKLFS